MEQLKLRQSSLRKPEEYQDTSQKKHRFKHYDYCDIVLNRHRISDSILVNSSCESGAKPASLYKSLNINRKTKRSFDESSIGNRHGQCMTSVSFAGDKSAKLKQSKMNDQLRYYKTVCKNLRKQNSILKEQHQMLLRKKQTKRKKKKRNKQNNTEENRFQQLFKQIDAIKSQLNLKLSRKATSKHAA